MSRKPLPRPRPCIITALEILGLDDLELPDGRERQALMAVELRFGGAAPPPFESHLSIAGRRVLHVAPIQPDGVFAFWPILTATLLQIDLLTIGVLVRGAITLGPASGGDVMFGRGLAQAERLRDEVAIVPRVIVAPRLLREVEHNPELRWQQRPAVVELNYLRSVLRADSDGLWYADYLRLLGQSNADASACIETLKDHRRLVIEKLGALPALDHASRAFTWLWSYHNLVVDEMEMSLPVGSETLAKLRIPATGFLVYDFPPTVMPAGTPLEPAKS